MAKDDEWLLVGDECRKLRQGGPGPWVACEDHQLGSVGLDVVRRVGHLRTNKNQKGQFLQHLSLNPWPRVCPEVMQSDSSGMIEVLCHQQTMPVMDYIVEIINLIIIIIIIIITQTALFYQYLTLFMHSQYYPDPQTTI